MKYVAVLVITFNVTELGCREEKKLSLRFSKKEGAESWLKNEKKIFLSKNVRNKKIKMEAIIAIDENKSSDNYYDALDSLIFPS